MQNSSGKYYRTNYTMNATKIGYISAREDVNLTESKGINLSISIAPFLITKKAAGVISGVMRGDNEKVNVSQSINISANFSISSTGKFYLISSLYSEISQRLDRSTEVFYVTDSDISLALETDKDIYRPGENISINATVSNRGKKEDMSLVIKADGSGILSENFTLKKKEDIKFNTGIQRNKSFLLEGSVLIDGTSVVSISDYIRVEKPNVTINVTCPEVVGRGSFTVEVLLKNLADVDANLTVRIENRTHTILLQKSEQELIQEEFSLTVVPNVNHNIN